MTDRYYALTVVLEEALREDDAENLITAIKQLRHVRSVSPIVADLSTGLRNAAVSLAEQCGRGRRT